MTEVVTLGGEPVHAGVACEHVSELRSVIAQHMGIPKCSLALVQSDKVLCDGECVASLPSDIPVCAIVNAPTAEMHEVFRLFRQRKQAIDELWREITKLYEALRRAHKADDATAEIARINDDFMLSGTPAWDRTARCDKHLLAEVRRLQIERNFNAPMQPTSELQSRLNKLRRKYYADIRSLDLDIEAQVDDDKGCDCFRDVAWFPGSECGGSDFDDMIDDDSDDELLLDFWNRPFCPRSNSTRAQRVRNVRATHCRSKSTGYRRKRVSQKPRGGRHKAGENKVDIEDKGSYALSELDRHAQRPIAGVH